MWCLKLGCQHEFMCHLIRGVDCNLIQEANTNATFLKKKVPLTIQGKKGSFYVLVLRFSTVGSNM